MEKKEIKINFETAVKCILLLVIVCIIIGIFAYKNSNTQKQPIASNNTVEKSELKNKIKTFKIRFASNPHDTDVEYDFKNKTKTIIHYTSSQWDHTDEIIKYERFDELFNYLYNSVFPNNDKLASSKGTYGAVYAASKPYFDMYVDFNTQEEVPVLSNNWHSYKNAKTNLAGWTLNGSKLPSYWKELLNILEIDSSILSDGTTYDFNKSIY